MTGAMSRPRLELAAITVLSAEVGRPAAEAFLATYMNMLPTRLHRIVEALDAEDIDEAIDAVLSLQVTSAMAGAQDLERECALLVRSLRGQDGFAGHRDMLLAAARMAG